MIEFLNYDLETLNLYIRAIVSFLACSFAMGIFYISIQSNRKIDSATYLITSIPIGVIILSGLTYLTLILGHLIPSLIWEFNISILGGAIFILLIVILRQQISISSSSAIYSGIAVVALIFLRTPFLSEIILPPYSDSSIHYQIISQFINPNLPNRSHLSLGNIFNNYYHYGFHSIAAWLTLVSGLDVGKVMPLTGQLFLIVLPLSMYSLVFMLTRSHTASLLSGILSAIGWTMPAFSVNWGKYPALGSIAIAPALFVSLIFIKNKKDCLRIIFWLFLLLSISLIHTRILIVFIFACLAYYLSLKMMTDRELSGFKAIRYSVLYVLSLVPMYEILVDFYNGLTIFILLVLILPFAFRAYPRYSVFVFVFTFFVWVATVIPIAGQTMLDRQYVGMMLYIPFSIFSGLGLSGLSKCFAPKKMEGQVITSFFIGIIFLLSTSSASLYPDECCDYFSKDDQQAVLWIQENTSVPSLFLIASFSNETQNFDSDAGTWVYPLTSQPTNKLAYSFDWLSSVNLDMVCSLSQKDIYIYYGGRNNSFNLNELSYQNRIALVFNSNKTRIYKVTGCSK